MLLPLKQHSFKKLSKSNINYTNTFDYSVKKQKKIKTAQGHLYWDQEELISEKNRIQKISWDCPFKSICTKMYKVNPIYHKRMCTIRALSANIFRVAFDLERM